MDRLSEFVPDTAVLERLMGVASRHQRTVKLTGERPHFLPCTVTVSGQVFAVYIEKEEFLQHFLWQLRYMPAVSVRMSSTEYDRILFHQLSQLFKGQEFSFLFIRFQTLVHFQDALHRADDQCMSAFRYICLHTRKDAESALCHKRISFSCTPARYISVHLLKAQRVEMLCQAECVQSGFLCLPEEPVRIFF